MHRILVPIDENEERTEHQAEYVASLPVDTGNLEVTLLHVVEADYEGAPTKEFEDVPGAMAAVEEIREAGITVEYEQRGGPVARNILDAVEDLEADEIVIAGRKRSGVMKVVIGSVTRDVLRAAECAVTVVG